MKKLKPFLYAAGFLVMVFACWRGLAELGREARWPTVEGRIIDADVVNEPDPRRRHHDDWVPRLHYEYSVNGSQHIGRHVSYSRYGESTDTAARKALKTRGWEAGAIVTVHYDPDDESKAVLDVRKGHLYWVLALFFFLGLAALNLAIGYQNCTRGESDEPISY